MTHLSSFGRDPAACDKLARALGKEGERLEEGMPIARAADDLVHAHNLFVACLDRFRSLAVGTREEPDKKADENLSSLAATAAAIVARERRLNDWCAWIAVCREVREAGLGALVSALEAGAVAHGQTIEAFRTAYACWLAPILIDARPALKRFSTVRHEELIRMFRDLDSELAELTAAYIQAKLSGCVPARDGGEAPPGYGVLSRELQKRMHHKPVRQLVSEMGEALTTLMPCLMMSPLSVAQFLPAEIKAFDLVVFDEASQITVPDAIGAIARGKHCIVVGDPKQMPPTRFFERGAEDDENEEVRDLESILDEALAARVPHHRLTGHYRSRHESLICFSNHAYYQGALITYPAADTRETAVTFRRVEGVYAKGRSRTNEIEAKAVVAEVLRRLRDPRRNHLSIGVVTLNAEQQRLVEELLDQERRADPEIERFFRASDAQNGRPEPVFVKNLETVQGDQRDVILLSVGYGPTEPCAKTMSMNFGPLNRQGGERRLNVAITRATTEVVVFASFDASMIDLSRTSAEAVKVDRAIAWAEANAAISPVLANDDLPAALREYLQRGSDILDALVLARQTETLLVTDDLPTREINCAIGRNGGAWLHVIFGIARDSNHIDTDKYIRWSAYLIDAGHNYLGVSGPMLAHSARLDAASGGAPGYIFRMLSQMIGGRSAEPLSHVQATIDCLQDLWEDSRAVGYRRPATGHLLRQLVRDRDGVYAIILRTVLARTRSLPGLAEYVRDWLRGHFLLGAVLDQKR